MTTADVFNGETTPGVFRDLWTRMEKKNGVLVGRLRPWAWFGEITRGCNLRCGFCATRTFKGQGPGAPKFGTYEFLTEETWRHLLNVMKVVSPYTRLEIGNAGEPTLNPGLTDFLRLKKEIAPHVQVLVYTNGTTLMSGKRTYKELFDAGLNVLYVNLYYPAAKHIALAEKSGYTWLFEGRKNGRGDYVSPFQYRAEKDPDFHLINFCRNPGHWTRQRRHRHGFSTFYNHLDWQAAAKYGLKPVTEPLKRRCDFPLKYPAFEYTGRYILCCWDFTGETAGEHGSVADGVDGFFKFWLGEHMQRTRQLHYAKDRAGHPVCARCGTQSHRGDIPWWTPDMFGQYWDGRGWQTTRSTAVTAPPPVTGLPLQFFARRPDTLPFDDLPAGPPPTEQPFDDGAHDVDCSGLSFTVRDK